MAFPKKNTKKKKAPFPVYPGKKPLIAPLKPGIKKIDYNK